MKVDQPSHSVTPPREVAVETSSARYVALVGEGLLAQLPELILTRTTLRGRCAVITDDRVAPHYLEVVRDGLEKAGFGVHAVVVPAGEKSKSMARVAECCDAMIAAGLDRASFVVALGGGVVGDLAGFVAAIYYRGIPFVQVPTTIVAQVDSSVGGKTGVNAPGGKNLLGAFHQPALVVADPRTLRTLPEREFREGFAEVVKHGIIRDAALLDLIQPGARENLTELIARNIGIKAAIVAADERELSGQRALLNFGHTIGHAIENAAGYGEWFHGEAVSLGMVAALRLSRELVGLSEAEENRCRQLLVELGLPTDLSHLPPVEELLVAMRKDKKFVGGLPRFVLTPRLGEALVSEAVTEEMLRRVLAGA
jgi:3-dehydroquinate synthase